MARPGAGASHSEEGADDRANWDQLACAPLPRLATTAFEATDTRAPYHWTMAEGCVPVTYDPRLADLADEISAAVAVWNAVPCSRLRLCAPVAASPDLSWWYTDTGTPENLRFIHVTDEDLNGDADLDPMVRGWEGNIDQLLVKRPYGRMLFAGIQIHPDELPIMAPVHWARAVGMALGIGFSSQDAASIFTRASTRYVVGDPSDMRPSDADVTTLCALYGEPPHCPEPRPF